MKSKLQPVALFPIILFAACGWVPWKFGYMADSMGNTSGALFSLYGTLGLFTIGMIVVSVLNILLSKENRSKRTINSKSANEVKQLLYKKLAMSFLLKLSVIIVGLAIYYYLLILSFTYSSIMYVFLPILFYSVAWFVLWKK